MRCCFALIAIVFLLPAISSVVAADDAVVAFKNKVMPVLSAHCTKCHGVEKQKAKLNLGGPRSLEQLGADSKLWFRVVEQIESGTMPPDGEKPLSIAERNAVANWARGELTSALASVQQKEGRSKFRRLNRAEYANTIHDLFGFRPPVLRDLPGDGRVDGYDKVSAALPFSSSSAEGFVKITEDILGRMIAPPPKQQERSYRLWGGASEQSAGHILELPDGTMVSFNTDTTSGPLRQKTPDGKLTHTHGARVPGLHRLRLSVYGYQTDKPLLFGIYAGHTGAYPQLIDLVGVLEAAPGKPTVLETQVYLRTRLDNDLAPVSDNFRLVPFGLGVQVPKNSQASQCKGPGLAVQWVEVEEPELPLPGERWLSANVPEKLLEMMRRGGPAATLKALLTSMPNARGDFLDAMRVTFQRIGPRLYRRDLTAPELETILENIARNIDSGAPLKSAFLNEVAALMTAPDFLCVVEQPGKLNDFALASRLAYFLWNSTPDEELLDLARKGRLADSKVLREQTDRLLKDPKSQRFVNSFMDQWLGLWGMDNTTPDKDLYPEYDDVLKMSSVLETQASFRRMLEKNLSVRDFVAPNWALVNERLAQHYGLPSVSGFALRETKLAADSPFGGVWTQAAPMKVTANGTLTSPVKRGVWVAERLLGIPIPPPPPNIEPVDPDTRGAKTLREQLALHSSQGNCRSCHAKFDPYGFALESFDVMGTFRTKYRESNSDFAKAPANQRKKWRDGLPVDCSGTTPSGAAFAGVVQLRQMLAKNPEQLARGVTRHLLTYSTGAQATPIDQPAIDAIVKTASASDYGLRSLVHGIIQSEVFRSK
ncbi:MAG: DUF1592 domain-containing protein [Pedosphaera sp.]|nr:DUF1592 domain-containing protein [Pedosphaera sp.]